MGPCATVNAAGPFEVMSMTDPARPVPSSGFLRCQSCGTPNPPASYVSNCLGCGKPLPRKTTTRQVIVARPVSDPSETGSPSQTSAARLTRGRILYGISWVYAGVVLLVLVLIRWVGDAWWGITPLLFTPRWAFLLPLAALAAASGLARCFRHWWLQGAIALAVAWPLMGLGVPVFTLWPWQPRGERVRVATFNLGLAPVPTLGFEDWLKREGADVVCFQEGPKAVAIYEALAQTGWNLNRRKTIASRFPIVAELEPMPDAWDTEERYSARLDRVRLKTPGDREFVVASVHLPTIRPGFVRLMRGDVKGLTLHVAWWGSEMSRVLSLLSRSSDLPMVVGGDFNMPSDDSTMAALRNYFRFAFDEAGWGYGYTRPAGYPWVRIDHLLSSPEWTVTRCRVGPDLGSDHLPVIAEFVLPPPESATGATPRDGGSGRAADR